MLNKKFLKLLIILTILIAGLVLAKGIEDIQFPIAELDNCQSQADCEVYCDDINRLEDCLDFAEIHNLMTPQELAEAEAVDRALKAGAKLPGGCGGKQECDAYCNNPSHMPECLDFAGKAGFISGQELREARQVAKALAAGVKTPGGCFGKEQCDAYCQEPAHIEECVNFALAAGLIPADEAEEVKRILPLMIKGEMPGGCMSKQECEAYCQDEANMEECAQFALKAGLMSQEEAEMFRKTGGKGPGGCRSQEECDAFCNNPANEETCFQFAKEHGLIPEEKLREMQEGLEQMREGLQMAPPEVLNCLRSRVGEDVLNQIQAGTWMPSQQIGQEIQNCFEQFMPEPEEMGPPEGMGPGGSGLEGMQGPGGCMSRAECDAYCQQPEHWEECTSFLEQ